VTTFSRRWLQAF